MDRIAEWRKKIDEIDLKLVKLLNRRGKCAIEIGKIKEKLNIQIYDPKREKDVVRNVQSATNGPLTKGAVRRLFERIIDESRRAERETRKRRKARGARKARKIRRSTEKGSRKTRKSTDRVKSRKRKTTRAGKAK